MNNGNGVALHEEGNGLQVWAVANQKGGVGKTTTSVALAGLVAQRGQRVLLVDLDPHGSLTAWFRMNPDALSVSVFSLFEQSVGLTQAFVGQVICSSPFPNLYLLPASAALATLERRAIGKDGQGLVLSRALAQVADDFDLVIIDCPPQLGVLMINALAACQQLIIPVQTEYLAIRGLDRMLSTLAMVRRSRRNVLPYLIVPTMYDRRTQASVSSLRVLRNDYGEHLWPGKIPVDTRFRDASKAGMPPHLYAPQSHGIQAYSSLLGHAFLRNLASPATIA